MRNDLRGRGAPMMNKLSQLAVIGFDVSLASANFLSFEPKGTEVEGHLSFFGQIVFGSRILGHE